VRVQAFGFEKDLVRILVGKAVDLVLDARAVARPHALDDTGVHRRAVETATDDVMRRKIGVRDPAVDLRRMHVAATMKDITGSGVSPGCGVITEKSHRARVDTRRRTGLHHRLP